MACEDIYTQSNPPYLNTEFFDYAYFLQLFSRIYPPEYLETLRNPGPGYEVIQAMSKIGQRLSLATARLDAGAHILESYGPALATGEVLFSRLSDSYSVALNSGLTYSTLVGTVAITLGSPSVVGTGTAFTKILTTGSIVKFQGGSRPYRVLLVTDDTHITLTQNIIDATAAGLTWAIGWQFGVQQPNTIAIINGSPAVVGTATTFTTQAKAGTLISFTGGTRPYRVLSVADDLHLTLTENVVEATVSGLDWFTGDGEVLLAIKQGTTVQTSIGGRAFTTTLDVDWGIGEYSKFAPVQAVAPSFQYNVTGEVTTATGVILPGEVDTITKLVEDPPYSDPSFTVSQPFDICGGTPPALDQLGADRGLPRHDGETDDAYRFRIRKLPDTVSPVAILAAINSIMAPLGATFDFIETWEITYQTCWDAPSPNIGTPTYQATPPTNPLFDENLFVYDDPAPPYPPFRNRWLSIEDYRAAFIVVVPELAAITDVGMAYDDTAVVPADLQDPIGKRAVSAYDVPTNNFAGELQGGYDGFDLGKNAVYLSLASTLDSIKAAGVTVEIEIQGS